MKALIRTSLFLSAVGWMAACGTGEQPKTIVISNPVEQARQELVSIPYADFIDAFGADSLFNITDKESGTEIAYQLETKGHAEPQNILLHVQVPASGSISLIVESGAPTPVEAKTFARYVPERLDDFAWENDLVAFRMYGKALEGRPDDAQGLDLWSKRTPNLVIDKWYAHGDYHKDHGEGMDYYSVGQTLGAGDIAPYSDGTVHYPKHYRNYEILDNGPLRSTFRLDYEPWQVEDKTVSVSKLIGIDAGSQLNTVQVTFTIDGDGKLPVALAVARREQPGELLKEEDQGLLGYWEPEHGEDGITGVGVALDDGTFDGFEDLPSQYLALFTADNGTPITYYNGGAWSKAGKITTAEEWFNYLKAFKERQASPLAVEIK
ncbi:DUF4861 domain-containing protein [Parapedobacter tibetensis]|uniref:DUF4861 domain-containing protein n=1 Tax=Parapedobacter tibetensis TaxID=2972951 RepID=UPI00214D3822|nr:DUF4861 domain-containing protein [Parapedobacter tibetensis]